MKITEYNSIKSVGAIKKRGSTTSIGGFSDILDAAGAGSADGPAVLSDVAATSALSNLLALQEISQEDVQRRKLVQQGSNMLETLEDLRRQILMGEIPMSTLRELNRQLSIEKQFVSDPQLNEVIEDIELRAAVELAKLEMAAQPPKKY